MKRIICFLLLLTTIMLVSCNDSDTVETPVLTDAVQTEEKQTPTADDMDCKITGTKDGVEDFLTLFKETEKNANKKEYNADSCFNITTSELSEFGASIFKFSNNTAAYLEYNGKVYRLGTVFGGYGITDMALADLNKDGLKELYYTYSFGGENTRHARAALFDFDALLEKRIEGSYAVDALSIEVSGESELKLYSSDFYSLDGDNSIVNFGLIDQEMIATVRVENGQLKVNSEG